MTSVELRRLSKKFGSFEAVQEVNLQIADGAFVSLLGPSGCGKTTILRMIAGLESPSSGDVFIGGSRVTDLPVHKRNIGFVFQNYALFPHKTVFDNVAFGLRYRNLAPEQIRERVGRACEMVRLPSVGQRLPSQLSGGQQQRIALARAIVIEPDVLLLDEPLSALDASLRGQMRTEIRRLQRQLGITAVFVTHDQEEALSMSDEIVLLNRGIVQQVGSPKAVYRSPQTRFVAEFLGQANILSGHYEGLAGGLGEVQIDGGPRLRIAPAADASFRGAVSIVLRAHRLAVSAAEQAPANGATCIEGTVIEASFLGNNASYLIDIGPIRLNAVCDALEDSIGEGQRVWLHARPSDYLLLDGDGERVPQVSHPP